MSSGLYRVEDIPRRDFLKKSLTGGVVIATAPAVLSSLFSCGGPAQVLSAKVPTTKGEMDPVLLNRTIQKALEKGGDFAEVYVEHRISRKILMEESKFKSAVFGISQGAGDVLLRLATRASSGISKITIGVLLTNALPIEPNINVSNSEVIGADRHRRAIARPTGTNALVATSPCPQIMRAATAIRAS